MRETVGEKMAAMVLGARLLTNDSRRAYRARIVNVLVLVSVSHSVCCHAMPCHKTPNYWISAPTDKNKNKTKTRMINAAYAHPRARSGRSHASTILGKKKNHQSTSDEPPTKILATPIPPQNSPRGDRQGVLQQRAWCGAVFEAKQTPRSHTSESAQIAPTTNKIEQTSQIDRQRTRWRGARARAAAGVSAEQSSPLVC